MEYILYFHYSINSGNIVEMGDHIKMELWEDKHGILEAFKSIWVAFYFVSVVMMELLDLSSLLVVYILSPIPE